MSRCRFKDTDYNEHVFTAILFAVSLNELLGEYD